MTGKKIEPNQIIYFTIEQSNFSDHLNCSVFCKSLVIKHHQEYHTLIE